MKKKIFFVLLLAPLLLGAGCAAKHDNIRELFNRSFIECDAKVKNCAGHFSVATRIATDIESNMFQLNAEIIGIEDGSMVWWFEYGPEKDQLKYSTEPKVLTVAKNKVVAVSIRLKKLAPLTPYYYRVVGKNNNSQSKINGRIYFAVTVDNSCFGAGTWATFFGSAMAVGGAITANSTLIISGIAISASGIYDEEIYGNAADGRCKAVAGLLGGAGGYMGGKAYKDAHKQEPQSSPPPPPPPSDPPNGPPGGPSDPPN